MVSIRKNNPCYLYEFFSQKIIEEGSINYDHSRTYISRMSIFCSMKNEFMCNKKTV